MNLTALLNEAYLRGLNYLNDGGTGAARATSFINQGRRDLLESAPWPFLDTTTTGTAPLTISDLRDVLYVTTTNGELPGRDVSVFLADDPGLTQTGTALYWYLDGLTTLKVWPADTSTSLTVRYRKVPADLASGSDSPSEIPARYHPLIVDFAVVRGLRDRSNHDEADRVRGALEDDLNRMRDALLDEADVFQRQIAPSNA